MPILVLLLLLLPASLCAESLDLRAALRTALGHRPQLVATRQQQAAAEAAVGEARSRKLPHLVLSETFAWTDEPGNSLFIALNQERNVMVDPSYRLVDPAAQHDFETRLSIEQSLYDADTAFAVERAETRQRAATARTRWQAEQTGFEVFRAYLDVQQAQSALQWVESSRAEAGEISRSAAERLQAGVGLKADELRARVFLAEAERRALSARNDLVIARRALALAVGRDGGEVDIAAPLNLSAFSAPATDLSVTGRPDLVALAENSRDAALAARQNRADYWPRLGVGASYVLHDESLPGGNDGQSWGVRASLSWEFFDGFRHRAADQRLAAEEAAWRQTQLEAERQSRYRLDEARLRADEARLQLDLARQSAREADESYRLMQQRYSAGLSDLSSLLAAQSALDKARFDAVTSETRLLLALGQIQLQSGRFLTTFLTPQELSQ